MLCHTDTHLEHPPPPLTLNSNFNILIMEYKVNSFSLCKFPPLLYGCIGVFLGRHLPALCHVLT